MFTLDLSPTYWATVKFEAQTPEGLGRQVLSFDAMFPRMTTSELEAFGQRVTRENLNDPAAAALILRDWRDVMDRDGNALRFSADAVRRVLDQAGVAYAVLKAFRDSQPTAAQGN